MGTISLALVLALGGVFLRFVCGEIEVVYRVRIVKAHADIDAMVGAAERFRR